MSNPRPSARTGMGPAMLRELLESGPGAWSRAHLTDKYGQRALQSAIEIGDAVRVLPRTYCGRSWVTHFETRTRAASIWANPAGALGGMAAAHIYGVLRHPPRRVSVVLPRATHLEAPSWIRVRRLSVPLSATWIGDSWVVPVADALIQAWSELPAGRGTGMVVDAVRESLTSAEALSQRLSEYPRVRGRRALARLLEDLGHGVSSYLEWYALKHVFSAPDFAQFERQVPVRIRGRKYVLDMYHRRAMVAVELDGAKYHSEDAARRRDIERDANLASAGVVTLRFTYEDVMTRPRWCRARVRETVAARVR